MPLDDTQHAARRHIPCLSATQGALQSACPVAPLAAPLDAPRQGAWKARSTRLVIKTTLESLEQPFILLWRANAIWRPAGASLDEPSCELVRTTLSVTLEWVLP